MSWADTDSSKIATGTEIQPAPTLRFDTLKQALRAAEAGAGVLLASLPLSNTAIQTGGLVRLSDGNLGMRAGYWITWARNRATFAERGLLIEILSSSLSG